MARTLIASSLRESVRSLMRSRVATALAVASLSVAIAASATIFGAYDAMFLQPRPVSDPESLYMLYQKVPSLQSLPGRDWQREAVSYRVFETWRKYDRTFEDMAAVSRVELDLTVNGVTERFTAELVSVNFFDVLEVEASMGRTFSLGDERRGEPAAVISHELWQARFASDPQITNRYVRHRSDDLRVIGVMPAGFKAWHGDATDIWVLITNIPSFFPPEVLGHPNYKIVSIVARGREVEAAEAAHAVDTLSINVGEEYRELAVEMVNVVGLPADAIEERHRTNVYFLMVGVSLLLLVAMANVSNIMLSELSSRKRELAIRMALGADWKQLAAYFFGRSILLSLAAVVGALLLTSAGFRIIFVVAPLAIQTLQPSLTANVITFMGVVSASVGIFIGVITTVQHSTGAPHQIIRQGMWGVGGSAAMHGMGGGRLRSALVLAQIVFATIVMVSATALSHKLYSLHNVAWGFDDEQVVFAQFVMAPSQAHS